MLLGIFCTICFIGFYVIMLNNDIGRNGTIIVVGIWNFFFSVSFFLNLLVFSNSLFCNIIFCSFSEHLSNFQFDWGFRVDAISLIFAFIVVFITTLVLFFAFSYMYNDPRFSLFIAFLQFFMVFMFVLIISDSLVQLFIGWEGVGIVSFILINFWFLRLEANKGALKALVFNRIGDFGYLFVLVFLLACYKTTNLSDVSYILVNNAHNIDVLSIMLLLAVFGKSAQLLLYAWLPDAMEGPTPVSSLLHSATMVTAGVYLIIRLLPLLLNGPIFWVYFTIVVSGVTSIFCGIYAFRKFDIKKIIAFSTCSQLGLMICAVVCGFVFNAFFHLFIHAFFKALLFVSSGIIIHSLGDEQDIRKYGYTSIFIPIFFFVLLLGSFNIIGFFFMSGFYSKEPVIISLISGTFAFFLKSFICLSSIFTVLYSVRLFYYNIVSTVLTHRILFNSISSLDFFLINTVLFLSIPSLFFGFLFSDYFIGLAVCSDQLNNVIFNFFSIELTSQTITLLFMLIFVCLCVISYVISVFFKFVFRILYINYLVFFFSLKEFYVQSFYYYIGMISHVLFYDYIINFFERFFLDRLSLFGFVNSSSRFVNFQNGILTGNLHLFLYLIVFSSFVLCCLGIFVQFEILYMFVFLFFLNTF